MKSTRQRRCSRGKLGHEPVAIDDDDADQADERVDLFEQIRAVGDDLGEAAEAVFEYCRGGWLRQPSGEAEGGEIGQVKAAAGLALCEQRQQGGDGSGHD